MSEEPGQLTRVSALHALAYCERLFYLEEVEEIRVADAAVYAGRALHDERTAPDPSGTEWRSYNLSSEKLGLVGRLDAARQRDGAWVPYEHKRGRARRGEGGQPEAWASDRLQVIAYALLLEEELREPVPEGRVRYHADNVTVRVPINDAAGADLRRAIERARELRAQTSGRRLPRTPTSACAARWPRYACRKRSDWPGTRSGRRCASSHLKRKARSSTSSRIRPGCAGPARPWWSKVTAWRRARSRSTRLRR